MGRRGKGPLGDGICFERSAVRLPKQRRNDMRRGIMLLSALVVSAALAIAGCSGGGSSGGNGSGTINSPGPSPTLQLTPATVSLPAGTAQQFTATLLNPDGSKQDVTQSVTWSSSATAIASVSDA